MKKWISTILSISLVIGMAAVLHACGKPKPETDTTTESATWSAEPDGETGKSALENLWDEFDDYDDESYSYTERTTDEHYQEEYDALTLPRAVTTQPVAGTTRAQTTTNPAVRETTTEFRFTSPSRASTTKQDAAGGTTAAGKESTTKSSTTTTTAPSAEAETTMLADLVGNVSADDVHSVTVMPRPQVTYLDRYVVDILESGTYTVQMEMKDGDMPVQITMYVKGGNRSIEIPVGGMMAQSIGLPSSLSGVGKVRVIVKDIDTNPKAYVTFSSVGYMEMQDIEDAADMIKEAGGGDIRQQLQIDRLQYCGDSFGAGYVCETYLLPEENLQYNFYFTETTGYRGLVRWDVVDLSNSQNNASMNMRLYDKVTDNDAFKVSGKKMDPSELEGLFS